MSSPRSAGRLLAALAALLISGASYAQENIDPTLKALVLKGAASGGFRPAGLMADTPKPRVNLMVRLVPGGDADALRARFPDAMFYGPVGGILTGEVALGDIARLAADPAVSAAEGARQLQLSLDIVRSSISSGGVWYGALDAASVDFGTNLGSGVVVGFVDSGIDYNHADFYTEGAPNRTRILSIWDQTDAVGPNPSGFAYGSEWSRTQIDNEIDGSPAGVVRQTDTVGHGTHVAGIAVGDGSASGTYTGLAPKADIIMVKSNLQNSKVVDGMNYIVAKAAAAGKRAVINLSLGGHYGPHDGTSTFETGVAAIAASTPVVVAMGNEEADSIHASTVTSISGTSLFTIAADAGTTSLEADFWVPSGDIYTATVSTSATGSTVSCAPGLDCTSLSISGHTIDIYNSPSGHPSGDRQITVDVNKATAFSALTWRVSLARGANAGTGRIDGYITTSNSSFTTLVDFTGTGAAPATANNVIAVGSYCSRNSWKAFDTATWTDTDCSIAGRLGNISYFSNRGPTRDGRQKPDVAAPGQRVASALSADQSPAAAASIKTPDGKHKLINGTSMATPVIAGSVARSLEKQVGITAAQIRSNIQATARSDAKVTSWGAVPNPVFGYGKARILGCGTEFSVGPATASPTVLGTSSISWTWANLAGATSYNVYYATSPATLITSVVSPALVQTSLATNTTMTIRVTGVNDCGEGPAQNSYSTATLAAPLASFAAAAHISSVTATWTAVPAGSGYLLQASTAADLSGTVYSSATSVSSSGGLSVTGLVAFTTYYVRAGTLNRSGGPHFSPTQQVFTNTILNPPGAGPFSGIGVSSITASWTLNGNSTGLEYIAQASTAANFSGTLLSSQTWNLYATFNSLSLNTTYYFQVRPTTGPYGALGSTATLSLPPGDAAVPFTSVYQTSVAVAWTAGSNPSGTRYRAELAATPDFLISPVSSTTYAASAVFTGLNAHTVYYLRVAALNRNSVPSSYGSTLSSSTLANAPGTALPVFNFVGPSSASLNWTALPLVPQANTCTRYVLEASTASNFTGILKAAYSANNTVSSLVVTTLVQDSTYYFRVGALNSVGAPVYTSLGSTKTTGALISSTTVVPGETTIASLVPSFPELSLVQVEAPPGAFPEGSEMSVNATLLGGLPAPDTNQGRIAPLGGSAGVDISAGGLQPSKPVTVRFTYVPGALGGVDPRRLVVGRYTGSGWTLLPTTVDPSANTMTAQTSHFSVFAPLVVTAGTSLDSVQMFPNPWKPGSGSGDFDAQGVSLTNLPDGAEVRIFTILGEEVESLSAGPSGIVLWDGKNSHGRRVGSGTYLVVVSGAGSRRVLRVAVVR